MLKFFVELLLLCGVLVVMFQEVDEAEEEEEPDVEHAKEEL